ncbi:MAG: hypothetical protein OEY56_13060 [Cyclobacteriaceae bacterium]|nr:hypothetical protein [Cyclobacteriaceae bacterium]
MDDSTAEPKILQDIPTVFFSFETKMPFERCMECEEYLLDGKEYMIEKVMRRYEGFSASDTIIDYALCISCAMKLRE